MQPLEAQPESESAAVPRYNRRFFAAMLTYAALAVLAAFRLDGRPRLIVWLCLGLFAFKTLLLVLKRNTA